ncbi:MAG: hypothetical protein IJ849_10850 [Selenomonadaceae bacterium]|nr:hypothetical protein [Selenomonadaceae bacterium]
MEKLGITFVDVRETVYISTEDMGNIQLYIIASSRYETDRYIYGHFKLQGEDFIWDEERCFFDRYRCNVFHLPPDTPLLAPLVLELSLREKEQLHGKFRLNSRKTVILAPYANSTEQLLSEEEWQELALLLRQRGFVVYTNIVGDKEAVIPGTMPLQVSFRELHYLADKVCCVVGQRSGLFDFLLFTPAKIICLLSPDRWHDKLETNYPRRNIFTLYYGIFYVPYLEEYRAKHNIPAHQIVNMNFPHVNPDEVYYERRELFAAILSIMQELS